jgi:ABC-type polysaccharide transport system, permease component
MTEERIITAKRPFSLTLRRQKYLILMLIPSLVLLIIFSYIPLWGWYMAFVEYKIGTEFFEQTFVGLRYFKELMTDTRFQNAFQNTLIMSTLGITIGGFIMPISFAVFINEVKHIKFKKTVQTISYLPHFVSWVVVSGIVIQVLSPESGVMNEILLSLGLIKSPINFLAVGDYFYWIVTIADLWKELGWNAIIFIAAIAGIDQEMYEAADIDGAGRFRKIWNITLPAIRPTIIIIFIISIGGLVNTGFEKQMLLRTPLTLDKAEVIDLYVLKYGIGMMRFSFGTAVGIFKSVISVALMLITNALARRFSEESLI